MSLQWTQRGDGRRTSSAIEAVPEQRAQAFLFADLCGFVAYTQRHGDATGAALALRFHRRARELAREEGCVVVKTIGDAVMVRSGDCRAALRLGERLLGLALEGFPPVRAGLDVGPAVRSGDDWFGSTVNTAARIADAARPGELVVSERAREAVMRRSSVVLVRRGRVRLKGLPALRLHALADPAEPLPAR
jgi:class 3 adenylate cyclase